MPITTYKLYRCPKCGYEKKELQGDVIVSLPACPKCQVAMDLVGNAPSWFKIAKGYLKLQFNQK